MKIAETETEITITDHNRVTRTYRKNPAAEYRIGNFVVQVEYHKGWVGAWRDQWWEVSKYVPNVNHSCLQCIGLEYAFTAQQAVKLYIQGITWANRFADA